MEAEYVHLLESAQKAEQILLTSSVRYRALGDEPDVPTKISALNFLRSLQAQAAAEDATHSIEEQLQVVIDTFDSLPPQEREPSFRCVASNNACMAEAQTWVDKALCGVALIICLAKEVIPLA